jgi:hypothetical protein
MIFHYSYIDSLHHVQMQLAHTHNVLSNWVRLLNNKNGRIGLTETETMILDNAIRELDEIDKMCIQHTVDLSQ